MAPRAPAPPALQARQGEGSGDEPTDVKRMLAREVRAWRQARVQTSKAKGGGQSRTAKSFGGWESLPQFSQPAEEGLTTSRMATFGSCSGGSESGKWVRVFELAWKSLVRVAACPPRAHAHTRTRAGLRTRRLTQNQESPHTSPDCAHAHAAGVDHACPMLLYYYYYSTDCDMAPPWAIHPFCFDADGGQLYQQRAPLHRPPASLAVRLRAARHTPAQGPRAAALCGPSAT